MRKLFRKLYRKVKTFFLRLYVKAHLFTTTQRKAHTERVKEKANAFHGDIPESYRGLKRIIGYTSNARLMHPQFHKGIPSASANHLVLGMVEKWGIFCGGEAEMLAKLRSLK